MKVVPNIAKNIVSVEIFLQDGADMEANLVIMNVKYKGNIMKFRIFSKDGLY